MNSTAVNPHQVHIVTTSPEPLALVFTDMVGSSAAKRADSLGQDATARDHAYLESIQSKHLKLVRDAIAEHKGTEIMTIGDSFFLTFEDVVDAVRCSAAIQQRLRAFPIDTPSGPLQLRIGIHIGRPEYFENSWHGTDVDTAARAESAGSPGQIVLTDAARTAASQMAGIAFRPLGTFVLKGVGDVKLWDADYDQHGLRKPVLVSKEARQRRNLVMRSVAAALILITVCVAGPLLWRWHKAKVAASLAKDAIILCEVANKTGDPVLDNTLTQAIAIQLAQSPVLSLVSEQHIQQSMRYLGKSSDEVLTPALAREIGEREGIKAYLTGTIGKIGDGYLITLTAVDTRTGDEFASEQAQAADKDHVLDAVSKVSSAMRARLGESLSSIQKLDTPAAEATTSSLEAFQAYALGEADHDKMLEPEAESHYERATELDPNFAMAWARLGVVHINAGQGAKALQDYLRAFSLSKNVSERERLYIQGHYYMRVTGNLDKSIETLEVATKTYPLDEDNWVNLGVAQQAIGKLQEGLASTEKAVAVSPEEAIARNNLMDDYIWLDRYQEAAQVASEQQRLHIDNGTDYFTNVYQLYLLEGNTAAMETLRGRAEGRADQFQLTQVVALSDEYEGKYHAAERDWQLASAQAAVQRSPDAQAAFQLNRASGRAIAGNCQGAAQAVHEALALDKTKQTLVQAARTAALCGDKADALPLLDKLASGYPEDTLIQQVTIPQSHAEIALAEHQPAEALVQLEGSKPFDLVSNGAYLRGLAYLELHDGFNAIDAFQRASQYKGACLASLQDYGQVRLGLARAYTLSGDRANAKKTYQELFALWKDADSDLPQLVAAKKEYAALK